MTRAFDHPSGVQRRLTLSLDGTRKETRHNALSHQKRTLAPNRPLWTNRMFCGICQGISAKRSSPLATS